MPAGVPEAVSDFSENFISKIRESLITWFANTTNGIKDFFANRIHTKTLCLGEEKDETCVTKPQLDQMLLKIIPDEVPENNRNGDAGVSNDQSSTPSPLPVAIPTINPNPSPVESTASATSL